MTEVRELATALRELADAGHEVSGAADTMRQAASAIEALSTQVEELKAALRPFARQAQIFDPYHVEPMQFVYTEEFEPFDLTGFGTRIVGLTVGDLRRARALSLEAGKE